MHGIGGWPVGHAAIQARTSMENGRVARLLGVGPAVGDQ